MMTHEGMRKAAQQRAKDLGTTVAEREATLDQRVQRLRQQQREGCLSLEERDLWFAGLLSGHRLMHLAGCPMCGAEVSGAEVAQPEPALTPASKTKPPRKSRDKSKQTA